MPRSAEEAAERWNAAVGRAAANYSLGVAGRDWEAEFWQIIRASYSELQLRVMPFYVAAIETYRR